MEEFKRKIVSPIEISKILEYVSQKDPDFDVYWIEAGVRSREETKKIIIKGNYLRHTHGRASFQIYEISFIGYEDGKVFIKDLVVKNGSDECNAMFDDRYWEKNND